MRHPNDSMRAVCVCMLNEGKFFKDSYFTLLVELQYFWCYSDVLTVNKETNNICPKAYQTKEK